MAQTTLTPHDCLFKWAISAFFTEFFLVFFPKLTLISHHLLDKEHYTNTDKGNKTTASDLALRLRVQTASETWDMIIIIEMKSRREDASAQVRRYIFSIGIVYEFPIWPVVLYTDLARWKKAPTNSCTLAYTYKHGKLDLNYDIIKLSNEPSQELLAKGNMLASLFALRGNPEGLAPESLVEAVCRAAKLCHDQLTDNQRLLVENFINAYSPVEPERLSQIKEKYQMYYAPTLEGHIAYVEEKAMQKGEEKGLQKGLQKGKLEGKNELIAIMEAMGRLSKAEAESLRAMS